MALIGVAELADALAGPNAPTVLDVRWSVPGPADRDGYLAGHIPGAVFADLDAVFSAAPGGADGGRHPLPDPAAFTAAMRALGVYPDRPVVLYDEAGAVAAGRGWWCLRYFGHPDVRVLDGGLTAWHAAGRPLAGGAEADPVVGDFTADPGGLPVLTASDAAALARSGLLLDARSADRYRGESPGWDTVAGHIPGAVSAPTTDNLDAAGRWLPPAALRERLHALGVLDAAGAGAGRVGVYCGSGVSAAHTVLAVTLTGAPAPALYVGSWSEWSADPERPVATGAEPG